MANEIQYQAAVSSDAKKDPIRVVFLTPKTSAAVKSATETRLMSYPHLLLREMLVLEILTILLVVVALVWQQKGAGRYTRSGPGFAVRL